MPTFPSLVRLLLVLILLVTASPGQPQQPSAASATASGSALARLPFEMSGNGIFLQLRVNGSKRLWFGLDTGAFLSVINSTTAQSLGLQPVSQGFAQGAGGRVESGMIPGVTFDIGPVQLTDLAIGSLALASVENSVGRRMDGILGAEFFRRFVVEIDFLKKELSLYKPSEFDYRGSGETLPLSFFDNHPYVKAKLLLPGREAIEGEFVIDSGSNFPLILLPSFVERHQVRESLPAALSVFGRGVGGEIMMPLGRAQQLQLGRFKISQPVTALPRDGTFGASGKAGNIGAAILRRFKVVFDYSRSRVILEPNERFADPYVYDMSGLQLVTEGPDFALARIHRVLPDSPAAEAGLKTADEILTVDGRAVSELKLAGIREMLRLPDQQYQLQIRRGREIVPVSLKTRPLI